MNSLIRLLNSTVGRKFIMAITGLALFGFVIGHMLGNLQIFLGRDLLNRYGHFLQSTPEILWPARLGLLACVSLHIWAAITLTLANRAARPVAYTVATPYAASYASRTMIWSGLIVFAFIVYHLAHFTLGLTHPDHFRLLETLPDGSTRKDIFAMVVKGFQQPLVSGFYVVAMALLCTHLRHGVNALFQSLGWVRHASRPLITRGATIAALVIFLGNTSIPLAILLGYARDLVK